MSNPKDVKSIPISSQNADDIYNKESAKRKMKDMGMAKNLSTNANRTDSI